ncbi:transglycosylase SLT domain-containing protein [Psychrobacter aquimaris]|uniref:transglycosylase SLT domain-containing protein n=1 Tax=Psychrobacter aquimaris TaxID=292733 RepID=UPI003FD066FC
MGAKVLQRLDILLFANTAQYRSEMRDTQQSTTTMMGAIKADAANMAKVGAAAFAGMAAAGTAAIGVMIKEQTELASEIVKLAKVSNTNIDVMQKHIVAARAMGVEQETLGDIYKDTQDKIGDFLTTGGGAMADFFESMPANVNMTAESFRKLSGPEALQRYYNGLQDANLSNAELIFYMESIASDASLLIPLLHDNGAGFDVWAEAAENAGVIMDEKTVAATQDLIAANSLLTLSVEGAKTQFTSAFIPVLADVADELVGTAGAADLAREMGEDLVVVFKSVAKVGIGVAAVFDVVGSSIGGVAATVGGLLDGVSMMDSVWVTSVKIAKNFGAANEIARLADQDISASLSSYAAQLDFIDNLGSGKRESRFLTAAKQQEELRRQLGLTGQAVQANAAAEEEAAKAAEKAAKASQKSAAAAVKNIQAQAVNSKVLAQAQQFNYGNLEREYGLPAGLLSAVSMQESRGNANARSPVGASGAFQFMPGTADRFGIRGQESNVGKSAEAAAKYLSFLMNKFGSVDLALAGYNAGEGNVAKYGNKIPPFKETQEYVKKVNGYLAFMKGGLDGSVNIAGNIASQTAIIEREAAEQARILEQQSKDRISIRLQYADEATRIEEQLKTDILRIDASGFNDDERDAFIADAIDIANEKLAQMQLVHDQEMQYAQQAEQTDADRIRNQYSLERREIQLTVNMDEQLRKTKIDALNQAEQLALDERRYAYERELRDLTSIGQSSLASLRQTYADQRRVLDQRTDIDDGQKSSLRDAMAGAQIYDTSQLQTAARDPFNAQQADMSGTGASYGLAQQYQSRLDVIQEALDAEVIAVEQAEQAKYAARYEFEAAATQLTLSQAEATAGSLAASFKTMLGEQNTAYKLLFAGQQAFVMASAGLNMWDAYGDAMAEGATMSQKFAAAATIATEFGRIITAASSMTLELPGYRDGGYTGDAPEDQIVGYVHGREHVSDAATTKRYRPELEAMSNGTYERPNPSTGNINVNVTVTSDGRSSVESDQQRGREFGNVLTAAIQQQLIKEQRQGGLLYRR